jgi:glycosyltransferase involved in cell wall biosynthesis
LSLEDVPDDRLQVVLRAADVVVLPYRTILNSGTALLALSFDVPIVVPALGAMSDLERDVGSDWVRTYDGTIRPSVLEEAIEWARAPRHGRPRLDDRGWDEVAARTEAFFREVTGRR